MSVAEIISPKPAGRSDRGQFLPGHSGFGGGRPKGSKCKVSETVYRIGAEHFEEHAKEAFDRLYQEDVATYCRVMVALATKEDAVRVVTPFDGLDHDMVRAYVKALEDGLKLVHSDPEAARRLIDSLPAASA